MHHVLNMTEMYACARKIDDVEALVQSTRVCTRCVYDNLNEHACMSVMYTSNLVRMHIDVYMNCKPRRQYKLYEHVLVLRCDCDSNCDTDTNATKSFLL